MNKHLNHLYKLHSTQVLHFRLEWALTPHELSPKFKTNHTNNRWPNHQATKTRAKQQESQLETSKNFGLKFKNSKD